jgi:hypothetical protein
VLVFDVSDVVGDFEAEDPEVAKAADQSAAAVRCPAACMYVHRLSHLVGFLSTFKLPTVKQSKFKLSE